MACGEMGPLDGGLIRNSTIQDSAIAGSSFTNGTVNASEIKSSYITGPTEIDNASARVIADAIMSSESLVSAIAEKLMADPNLVSAIANKVFESNPSAYATPSDPLTGDDLPTALYGARDSILGKPIAWVRMGDYAIPAYTKRS